MVLKSILDRKGKNLNREKVGLFSLFYDRQASNLNKVI